MKRALAGSSAVVAAAAVAIGLAAGSGPSAPSADCRTRWPDGHGVTLLAQPDGGSFSSPYECTEAAAAWHRLHHQGGGR